VNGPSFENEDVVTLGRRDAEEADAAGSQRIEDSGVTLLDLDRIRAQGLNASVVTALAQLTRPDLAGFWVHVDADVLDDAVMPAVDYQVPGGPAWEELSQVLATAVASGTMVGIDVAIFNPSLDPIGSIAATLADTIAGGLIP
jgi:arginase